MVLSRLLWKYTNLKMNMVLTLFCLSIVAKTWYSFSLSVLLSAVIFNHGAKFQRDKCVSDYVLNYEMEILGISLHFSSKSSLVSTLQSTRLSTFYFYSHTFCSPFSPLSVFQTICFFVFFSFPVCVARR